MAALPLLLIQLRRLGDLIMTFPLLGMLKQQYPDSPLFFAAEEVFYRDLKKFTPQVNFFPSAALPRLATGTYKLLVNLDNRTDAAQCAEKAKTDLKIGPVLRDTGLHVNGFWQLYRASLTGNNRHNLFHWADLNRLDLAWPLPELPKPRMSNTGGGLVGLFTGASEAAKRPEPEFWAALARLLLAKDYKPILLGGTAEKELGQKIARRAGLEKANFCGKTSLGQLLSLLEKLDLLITPDTGPMHLADWLGTRVLNLSMGNVNAWETGPMRAGQLIIRANMSCIGCWQCRRTKPWCRNAFNPLLVSHIAQAWLQNKLKDNETQFVNSSVDLLVSSRNENGLYELIPLFSQYRHRSRTLLDKFWREAFLFFTGRAPKPVNLALDIMSLSPRLALSIRKSMRSILSRLLLLLKNNKSLPAEFWQSFPESCRLFAGFLQMSLENDNFSQTAIRQALELTAQIEETFTIHS